MHTSKVASVTLPHESVAVQVTVWVPTPNAVVSGGVQTTGTVPSMSSVAKTCP